MSDVFINCKPRSKEDMLGIINQACDEIGLSSPQATTLLLVIAKVESNCEWTAQRLKEDIKGPARGLWQFERTGIKGILTHPNSRHRLINILDKMSINTTQAFELLVTQIWNELEKDDIFACKVARLLLWTDPRRLPLINDYDRSYDYYIRNWRPGKPINRRHWNDLYRELI